MPLAPLAWLDQDGVLRCDLSDAGEGAGTYLAVLPHAEPDYFRPVAVLVPGEEEREVGDGVLGREHAQDTIVKYAIQTLARLHGLSGAYREADEDDAWPARTLARLWALLAALPGAPRPAPDDEA
jgi:hypothetical protein